MARSTQIFQKRHFEFIARHLREVAAPPHVVEAWADNLRRTNPEFKRDRFIEWASTPADLDHEEDEANERNARALADATAQ
jgi:hypothetical protein